MFATILRTTAAALVAAAFSTGAHAEYRCNPAKSWVDREACKAASQGPDELRLYIQAMNSIRINVQFSDFVDLKTAQAWEARERELAAREKAATQLAREARR